ncbi:hypothetical protein BDW72DRAFT_168166 [Aspergillus terricola var. indicus]
MIKFQGEYKLGVKAPRFKQSSLSVCRSSRIRAPADSGVSTPKYHGFHLSWLQQMKNPGRRYRLETLSSRVRLGFRMIGRLVFFGRAEGDSCALASSFSSPCWSSHGKNSAYHTVVGHKDVIAVCRHWDKQRRTRQGYLLQSSKWQIFEIEVRNGLPTPGRWCFCSSSMERRSLVSLFVNVNANAKLTH